MADTLTNRFVELVDDLNRKDLDTVRRNLASDYFNSSPAPGEPTAAEVFHQLALDLSAAMPDLHIALKDIRTEGDLLRTRVLFTGTHHAPLWGAPGSGDAFSWDVDVSVRSKDDGLAVNFEDVTTTDAIAVLRRLGLVNPPGAMDQPLLHPVELPEFLLRILFTGQAGSKSCRHLDLISVIEPTGEVCKACVATGESWPALRMCLVCGFVGCCATSKNKHMDRHHEETGHPIFRSIRLDEGWIWCYDDAAFFSKRVLAERQEQL